ncbi:MAG: helicase-related protein [Campylobacterales bacterium]|nr:helicase-related protein [Campylobacterales bacterium]
MNKKATYKPTNQNTVVLSENDGYCEVLLDGDFKTVPITDLEFANTLTDTITLQQLKENIFYSIIRRPLSDIIYSLNSNRLTPEPHQYKPLIKFLNSEKNRVLIADEVGLGKTIEAGMIYKETDRREDLNISIIVVPSSLTYKWKDELEIRFDEFFSIKKVREFINFIDDYDTYYNTKSFNEKIIISYHTLRDERVMAKLQESILEVDFLIMDEAHTMRNMGTSTFDSAQLISSIAENIIFLSATPVQNELKDLFNILTLLDNDYFKGYDYFKEMIKPNPYIHRAITMFRNNSSLEEIKEYTKNFFISNFELFAIADKIKDLQQITYEDKVFFIDELLKIDKLSFIINRTKKKDVGKIIPRTAHSPIVDIELIEQEYYQSVIEFVFYIYPTVPKGFITIMPERMASSSMIASLKSFIEMRKKGKIFIKDIDILEDEFGVSEVEVQEEALSLLDIVISNGKKIGETDSKFKKFLEILQDIKKQNIQQVIVFSFFKRTIDHLEEKLLEQNYTVGKIYGDMTVEERYYTIKRFKKKEFDILLTSEVGSEGLDMQFCNVVVNYDLPWNPMRVEQRIGRIDRIGQKADKLLIFNLCITGSIEDRIFNKLYNKLNIFEESVGELEPILGDLEEKLNIGELIKLSDEELEKKLHIEELAIKRKEKEISHQTKEVEKLISEEYNLENKKEIVLNNNKITHLQKLSRDIVKRFLDENNIKYQELKDGNIKLSQEPIKELFSSLKSKMSDKRVSPEKYMEERKVLQSFHRQKELKISFTTNTNSDFNEIYIFLNHPIVLMITKDKQILKPILSLKHPSYNNNYAAIFRSDIKLLKNRSHLHIAIFDNNLEHIETKDYFDFIEGCSEKNSHIELDSEKLQLNLEKSVISIVEELKQKESIAHNRLIDIKIDSIKNYYQKKINKTTKLKEEVSQDDIQKMRTAEIQNLETAREEKIEELESLREIKGSFEILGILEMGE